MTQTPADVTILGAGPVGIALALQLARLTRHPERIVLCKPARASAVGNDSGQQQAIDPRVMALNHGSRVLLESLGAWPSGGADILDIHVSQRGRLGRTHISHTDFDVRALGTVLSYATLSDTLDAALARSGITVRSGASARLVSQDEAGAVIEQDGESWTTSVCVQAEGGTFDQQSRKDMHRPYDQEAVLATVRAERPRPGWAWERFTPEGPLALLPYPPHAGASQGDLYALVWCCSPARAQVLRGLNDADFSRELNEAFGTRLGELAVVGTRHAYPLGINLRKTTVDQRCVAIGNAAQTLHPVAGQGLNLGLRDAARLAQTLAQLLNQPSLDPRPLLAEYARARRADRWLTAGLTDFMPRIFTTGWSVIEHACGLALLSLDVSHRLRRPLARQLMEGRRS